MFTAEQVEALSAEIDTQLRELQATSESELKGDEQKRLPTKQSQAIEKVTGELAPSFLQKFHLAVRDDLCQEGGVLHTQWKKWADLSNPDVIDKFTVALVAMGFSGNAVNVLVVAVAVIVLHLGAKAFCEEYAA